MNEKNQKSEIEKALEYVPSYGKGMLEYCEALAGDEGILGMDFKILRQVERAYEQLQTLGADVSESLRERRYQLLELVFDAMDNSTYEICFYLKDDVCSRKPLKENTPGSLETLEKAIKLCREYTQKISPSNDLLTNKDYYFSE